MRAPTFTVQICNFNHGHYLPQCIAGIQRQTFTDFEIVITDDGSTDDSRQIIAAAAAKDPRFKPRYFPTNQGLMAATKDTLDRAKGTYIFGEAADDFIIDEHFFARAATALRAHPTAAGFFGIVGLFTVEKNEVTGKMGGATREGYLPPAECYRDFLRGKLFIPGSGTIWKRSCIQELGGFDYSLGPQIDFLLNHALPSQHGVIFTPTAVTVQRIYQNASSFGTRGGTLWDATARLEKVEKRLRELAPAYAGMEDDWRGWRARWTLDAIRKTGINV